MKDRAVVETVIYILEKIIDSQRCTMCIEFDNKTSRSGFEDDTIVANCGAYRTRSNQHGGDQAERESVHRGT